MKKLRKRHLKKAIRKYENHRPLSQKEANAVREHYRSIGKKFKYDDEVTLLAQTLTRTLRENLLYESFKRKIFPPSSI
jgi:hypothetical protein